jgi:hypothetical protein
VVAAQLTQLAAVLSHFTPLSAIAPMQNVAVSPWNSEAPSGQLKIVAK